MASLCCFGKRQNLAPPLIVITEPEGATRVLHPEFVASGEVINSAFVADDVDKEIRRKSSFALDDKIWNLEDQKESRQRILEIVHLNSSLPSLPLKFSKIFCLHFFIISIPSSA